MGRKDNISGLYSESSEFRQMEVQIQMNLDAYFGHIKNSNGKSGMEPLHEFKLHADLNWAWTWSGKLKNVTLNGQLSWT